MLITGWCPNYSESGLLILLLAYIGHEHRLNRKMKSASSLSSPSWAMWISKYSLQLSTRLPIITRKYLSSSSLVHIRKTSRVIWQLKNWLPSCMVSQRWMVHQLHISWSTLTHLFGKHYMNSSSQMLQP